MAVIPEEAGEPERIISRGGHLEKEPRHRPGQQADQQQCDRKEDKGQREPVRACFLDQNISPSRESGLRPSWFARPRSEERRVGKECVRTCRSRGWRYQ